jgi:hypothetical protein
MLFFSKLKHPQPRAGLALFLACCLTGSVKAATIKQGDIVVDQIGDGATALSSSATSVSVLDFTPTINTTTGAVTLSLSNTIALPTAVSGSNNPLTESGSAGSDGGLTVSYNGQYIVVPGYDATPGTSSVASAAKDTVGLINTQTGAIDTSTTTTVLGGNNFRSAVLVSGNTLYESGGNGIATQAVDSQVTSGNQYNTGNTTRWLQLGNNPSSTTAYFSASSSKSPTIGTFDGANIGTIVAAGTTYPNGPYGFAFTAGNSIMYVADVGKNMLEKFTLSGSTATADGSISVTGITGISLESFRNSSNTATYTAIFYTVRSDVIYELTDQAGTGPLTGTGASVYNGNNADYVLTGVATVPEPIGVSSILVGTFLVFRRPQRKPTA